jgi:iron-sulfur cluster insertion protein
VNSEYCGFLRATQARVFTDAAVTRYVELIGDEVNPNLNVRVIVQGDGCERFQYGFTLDEALEAGDMQVSKARSTLLIDPMSVPCLPGAEFDYREDLEGAQFVIRNTSASTTYRCKPSFSA